MANTHVSHSCDDVFDQLVVILDRPRHVANIGGVVRGMKNMGLHWLRLVAPVPFDTTDMTGIAHRSEDVLANLRLYDDLDTALADLTYVVGTTARQRGEHEVCQDIRTVTEKILARAIGGPVGLLFGSEDNGLDNAALDRCQIVIRIPTDPSYSSLNLSHAVLLLAYEIRMAVLAQELSPARIAPDQHIHTEQVTTAWRKEMLDTIIQALEAVEFFKTDQTTHHQRTLWRLINRADLDTRECALVIAMAREVVKFVRYKR